MKIAVWIIRKYSQMVIYNKTHSTQTVISLLMHMYRTISCAICLVYVAYKYLIFIKIRFSNIGKNEFWLYLWTIGEIGNCTKTILKSNTIQSHKDMDKKIKSEKMNWSTNNTTYDSIKLQPSMTLQWTYNASIKNQKLSKQKVSINYIGNKNNRGKGKYSERPEVLNKNFIRSLRRYLKEQFKSASIDSFYKTDRINKRSRINSFYNKHLKIHSQWAQNVNENEELGVLHILAVLLQENVRYIKDCNRYRKLKKNMNQVIRVYSRKLYFPIITMIEFQKFILIWKEAGLLAEMIEAYPTLAKSKDAYEVMIDNIITTNNH